MKNVDVIIVGGGLAGLCAAIHLGSNNLEVILIEKESFPHHKVCGEYLSLEIIPYLNSLDIDILKLNPKIIKNLEYTTRQGNKITSKLPLGGLGLSRYQLDNYLYIEAKKHCTVIESTVINVDFNKDSFNIKTSCGLSINSKFALGAFGKRSNIDKLLNREFIEEKSGWLGVKAHYKKDDFPNDVVALHNFNGGYCGLSKTEGGAVNVCYLATYNSFKKYKNTDVFKQKVLFENPILKEFFDTATPLFEKDLSIAQISFKQKKSVENHMLMLGDAAGLIHPLCGNGMAMAITSAKIASIEILDFFSKKLKDRSIVEHNYTSKWKKHFKSRINTGRILQKVLLNPTLANTSQQLIKNFPGLLPFIISKTHGNPV